MKSVIIFLLVVSTSITSIAQQVAFSNISLESKRNEETITFTIPREVNVKYYRIEACNDNISFEVINTLRPEGNTMFAKTYTYNVAPYNFKYYRIGKVEMNGPLPYSDVVTKETTSPTQEMQYTEPTPAIVAQ